MFAFFVLGNAIGIAVEHSAWYMVGAAGFVYLLVSTLHDPAVQHSRIPRLEAGSI